MPSADILIRNGSKTRVQFIKYHEAADQQPLSKKAAEKLGIFPSLALSSLAAWVRQNGFDVDLIDLHVENIYPQDAASRVQEYDPHIVALTAKTLGWPAVLKWPDGSSGSSQSDCCSWWTPTVNYPEESLS